MGNLIEVTESQGKSTTETRPSEATAKIKSHHGGTETRSPTEKNKKRKIESKIKSKTLPQRTLRKERGYGGILKTKKANKIDENLRKSEEI